MANFSQSKKRLFFGAKQLKQIPVFLIPKEEKEITLRETLLSLQRAKKYPNHSTKIKFLLLKKTNKICCVFIAKTRAEK